MECNGKVNVYIYIYIYIELIIRYNVTLLFSAFYVNSLLYEVAHFLPRVSFYVEIFLT